MIRTIKFVVDCKDAEEFTKIYLSIDDMWVEQVKSMSWEEGDTILVPPKESQTANMFKRINEEDELYNSTNNLEM